MNEWMNEVDFLLQLLGKRTAALRLKTNTWPLIALITDDINIAESPQNSTLSKLVQLTERDARDAITITHLFKTTTKSGHLPVWCGGLSCPPSPRKWRVNLDLGCVFIGISTDGRTGTGAALGAMVTGRPFIHSLWPGAFHTHISTPLSVIHPLFQLFVALFICSSPFSTQSSRPLPPRRRQQTRLHFPWTHRATRPSEKDGDLQFSAREGKHPRLWIHWR